jgi:hypothetical protein
MSNHNAQAQRILWLMAEHICAGNTHIFLVVVRRNKTFIEPVLCALSFLHSFAAMVHAWRSLWRKNTDNATEADFSFGWAQLNSYGAPDGPRGNPHTHTAPASNNPADEFGAWAPGFPSIRWAQTKSLASIPNSFQAVILDTPSPSGAIHSCFKQPVGSRLARGALATAYGATDWQYRSAYVSSAHRAGQELVVKIANASSLIIRAPLGFEVLTQGPPGTNGLWHSAPIIRTDGQCTITLSLSNVTGTVVALRYLWSRTPCSGDTFSCPVYYPVRRLGVLTGENDSLPLGPAILAVD